MAFLRRAPAKRPQPGKFIVIDGTDGSGKATQTGLLINSLKEAGYNVAMMDFPQYDTKSAGPLEKYLTGKYGEVNPQAASIMYAVDRFDASFKIRKLLDEGVIIIANRYVTSNAGHQGGKIPNKAERIKFFRWLDQLEYGIFNIPKPNLTIILHLPAEVTQRLVMERSVRDNRPLDIHETDTAHIQAAERVYLEIAKLFPNTKLVECMNGNKLMTPQHVHGKVWELVRRIALKNLTPVRVAGR